MQTIEIYVPRLWLQFRRILASEFLTTATAISTGCFLIKLPACDAT